LPLTLQTRRFRVLKEVLELICGLRPMLSRIWWLKCSNTLRIEMLEEKIRLIIKYFYYYYYMTSRAQRAALKILINSTRILLLFEHFEWFHWLSSSLHFNPLFLFPFRFAGRPKVVVYDVWAPEIWWCVRKNSIHFSINGAPAILYFPDST